MHGVGDRRALSIGVSRFGPGAEPEEEGLPAAFDALPFAPDRARAVAEIMGRFGYDSAALDKVDELAAASLSGGIWNAARAAGRDGVLVVHVISHGIVTRSGALFAVGADGCHHPLTDVGRWLQDVADFEHHPRTLFLLDLCHAGTAARLPWQPALADGTGRAWVIAACGPSEGAFNGRFSEAVVNVLRAFADREIAIDPARRHIPLATVAREIRREVKRLAEADGALPQEVTGSLVDISVDPPSLPFFPNPGFLESPRTRVRPQVDVGVAPFLDDVDETLDPRHFMERASGHGSLAGGPGVGCFSGRRRELQVLSAWLDGHDEVPLRVVTGSPGVGKSALLGVLICAAHPVLREPTEAIWHHVDRWPQRNPDLVAVHARQRSFDDIVGSLRRQLGIDGSGLVDLVAARSRQPTLVVDALDEAADPARIVSELLLPLAAASRPDGRPACRLLVAMRPWKEFDHLRAAAEAAGGLIDLDFVPLTQVRYDLENYVSDLVRCHPPYDEVAYAGARQTFAAAVATALTGGSLSGGGQEPGAVAGRKAWGEFLVAGLYAHHLVTAHGPISDVGDAKELGWRAPRTLPELLEIDLAARTGSHWLRPLLAALAHTRGDGMPARVAGHLSVVFTGLKTAGGGPARHEVAEALKAARFYLRQTTDVDGTTLYRLFHQGLADYLVEHPVERTRRDRIDPRAVLAALVAPLESADGSGRRWDVAEPYLLRHAVQHAADAGLVGELVADPEFLVYADPAYVAPLLDASARPPLSAAEYTALVGRSSQSRRQLLALYAARQHDHRTAYRLANPPGQPALPWQPLWSTAGADREISAIACAAGPEVVATGDAAGSIVLHDRYRGTALLPPLAGHEAPIDGLAFGTVGGVLALLSSDVEGRFRLWDGTTGRCLHIAWAGRPAPCTSLELLTFAGRVFVAAGNADQVILTDLVTGEDAHLPGGSSGEMAIMDGRLVSLAGAATDGGSTFTLGGSTFAVDGSSSTLDGAAEPELVVWDAASRQLVAAIPMPAPVERVATTPAGDILVLTGGQALLLGHKTAEPEPPSAPSDAPEQAEPAAAEPEPEERFVGRHAVPDAPPADGSQASHDEIMNAFFGNKSQGPRERTRPGADAILRLELDLHETAFGVEVPITVDTAVLCTTCAGAGAAPGTQLVSCDRCDGRGEVQSVQRSFLGQVVTPRRCTACEGYGTVIPHRCATCGGDGRVRTRRTLTVKVPPGVEDGTRVRLAQQGEVGPGGGTAGDLYVEIHERPHDVFSRKGDDLHCRVMLPTTAAALGTRLTIETLDGEKKIDVKPGTQPGAQLRLRGFGAHHLRGTGRGDLYVHLDARTPAKLNKVERELMERFQRLRPDLGSVEVVSEAAPGSDLELVATVPMALAALGAKLTLPTKDGPRQVDVPAGAQPGLTLRLKRVRLGAGTPADANVRVRVTVPSHLTPAQEAVLRDFSALRGEAPTTQVEDGFFTKMRKAFNGEL